MTAIAALTSWRREPDYLELASGQCILILMMDASKFLANQYN